MSRLLKTLQRHPFDTYALVFVFGRLQLASCKPLASNPRGGHHRISLQQGLQGNERVLQTRSNHFAISHLQQSHASGYACNRRAPTAASLGNKGQSVVVASASASLGFHPRGAALGAAQQVGGHSPCRRCRRVGVATRAFIERCSEKARPRCGASSCSPRSFVQGGGHPQ